MDQLNSNSELADYLVEQGACTRELADEMKQTSDQKWIPLGMIMIQTGKLRMRQIGDILNAQAEHPKKLFGNLAVELGHITPEDLAEAMQAQADQCPHILDLALESTEVDQVKLLSAVRRYIRNTERILSRLDDALIEPIRASH